MRPGSAPQSPRDRKLPEAKDEEVQPRFGRFEAMHTDARGRRLSSIPCPYATNLFT